MGVMCGAEDYAAACLSCPL